jgi:hypothetical protein
VDAADFQLLRKSPAALGRRGGFDLEVEDITGALCGQVLMPPSPTPRGPLPAPLLAGPLRVSQLLISHLALGRRDV